MTDTSIGKDSSFDWFEKAFNPRSIAVVGVSETPFRGGSTFFKVLAKSKADGKYKGDLYPVNPRREEVFGWKAFKSVKDIPSPVDYAVIAVEAAKVPDVIRDCAAKNVPLATIYSSGFSEAGTTQGRALEKDIVSIAKQGNLRLMGPNCEGIFSSRSGIGWASRQIEGSGAAGDVSILCQSGWLGLILFTLCTKNSIRVDKIASYGNASDLNESDFLDYFSQLDDTKLILAYIEGAKDGKRFFESMRRCDKPLIVLKGGVTDVGFRVASSHTGSLTTTMAVYDTAIRQAGALRVASMEEMIDTAKGYLSGANIRGPNVGLVAIGGGASVVSADAVIQEGLFLPVLDSTTRASIESATGSVGTISRNPLDLNVAGFHAGTMESVIRILSANDSIDLVIVFLILDYFIDLAKRNNYDPIELLKPIAATRKESQKPLVLVSPELTADETSVIARLKAERLFLDQGVPIYPSVSRAARAYANVVRLTNKISKMKV